MDAGNGFRTLARSSREASPSMRTTGATTAAGDDETRRETEAGNPRAETAPGVGCETGYEHDGPKIATGRAAN